MIGVFVMRYDFYTELVNNGVPEGVSKNFCSLMKSMPAKPGHTLFERNSFYYG